MSILADVIRANERYRSFVDQQTSRATSEAKFGKELLARWKGIRDNIATTTTPTGLQLPRLALPQLDDPALIARYLYGQGLPGEFPYLNGAYRQMYLEANDGAKNAEEPT